MVGAISGNEPPWVLELAGDGVDLTARLGERRTGLGPFIPDCLEAFLSFAYLPVDVRTLLAGSGCAREGEERGEKDGRPSDHV